jgi:hypothetical protein
MGHSHQPLSLEAGARLALTPNAAEGSLLSFATRLPFGLDAGEIAWPSRSRRAAIRRDLDCQTIVHALLFSIRKLRLRLTTTDWPNVTEPEQSGLNAAKLGMETSART